MPVPATDWTRHAACRNEDPELFFPVTEEGPEASRVRVALRVCASCPVRVECRNYALGSDMRYGIWGGLTERQRAELRSARRAVRALAG